VRRAGERGMDKREGKGRHGKPSDKGGARVQQRARKRRGWAKGRGRAGVRSC
jgi:hypothetical protein